MRKSILFAMAMTLALGARAAVALPEGYEQLEWIESTGYQYIDTGIVFSNTNGFRTEYLCPVSAAFGNHNLCGSRTDEGTDSRCLIGSNDPNGQSVAYVGWNKLVVTQNQLVRDNFQDVVSVNYLNSRKLECRGNATADLNETLVEQTSTFCLFGASYASNTSAPILYGEYRLFSFQISAGSSCIRDFVPARRVSDGVVGLYETIEGRFYENQNAGTREKFIAGPTLDAPTTYSKLEYLQSFNNEYIDTGITFTDRHGYEIEYLATRSAVGGNANVCGSRSTSGESRCVLGANAKYAVYLGWNSLVIPSTSGVTDSSKGTARVNFYNSRRADCRGKVVENLPELVPQTGNFWLFAGHYTYSGQSDVYGSHRIFSFKMTEGDQLILDLVPARRHPDGAMGMLDRQTGTFYPKQGSGAFRGGPDRVEPLPAGYAELPYLESTGTQYLNTGVKVSQNVRLEATVYNPYYSSRHIVGARTAFQQNALGLSFQVESGNEGYCAAYGDGVYYKMENLMPIFRTYSLGGDARVSVGGRTIGTFTLRTFSNNLDIYVFTVNNGGQVHDQSASVRMSALKIRDGYDLVRDYVPAMETNTLAVGFYDRVNGNFVTNAGTGTFRIGKIGAGFDTVDLIANGSFESGTSVAPVGASSDSGYALLADAGTSSWTGDGYVTRASNTWISAKQLLDGTFAVVLQDGKFVEQTVAAKSGVYRLIFNQRAPSTGNANTLVAKIGGKVVAQVMPSTTSGFVTENCDVKLRHGTHTLRFEGSGNGASCLDMVSLQLLYPIPSGSMVIIR